MVIEQARNVLRTYWSYDTFRPLQEDIISSLISGKDTFALLPTGGGKSICYQIPALCMEGICLVVSPLISLMADQVNDLKRRNIKALVINSFMSPSQIDHTLDNAIYGDYKLLYVSPERLKSEIFLERFRQMKISFIAVDEAHCISQWGYDFRPSYMDIHELRNYKDVPIIALTATATSKVVEDIIVNLKLREPQRFKKSFARDNIHFSVERTGNKSQRIKELVNEYGGSGIVYVRNRRKCREISELLRSSSLSADYYHAGLDHKLRQERQDSWTSGKTKIIAATNAFGMGIDKSDVRFVVHWDLPDSLEAFYQEAGRAGRDGDKSFSVILFDDSDAERLLNNFAQSFPELKEVKEIYHLLAQHFQIAEGSVVQEPLPFHLSEFCGKYSRNKITVFQCLRQLEQEGLIAMSSSVHQPSRVGLKGHKEDIMHFRKSNEAFSELIAFLLRAYSGIMEQVVNIDEDEIAQKLNSTVDDVKRKLNYLAKQDLIIYQEQGDKPRLTFLTPRLRIQDLVISAVDYLKRKEAHKIRMEAMLKYAESEDVCRSRIVLNYFDESPEKDCGHCDNCGKKARRLLGINKEDLKKQILINFQSRKRVSIDELRESLPNYYLKEIEEGCRELCQTEEIKVSGRGFFAKQ